MIKGAYSDKYKAAQIEYREKLKEQAKLEGKDIKDKVKELSKENNRRRRALEIKKKQLEEEEGRQREEVLAERHKLKKEATQKFQKESLYKKKTRPGSGKESEQTGSSQLQEGVRIVRSHIVEFKNGQQITRTVPTLEDALNLVNSPYPDHRDHDTQYFGPKEIYSDGDKSGTFSAQNMSQVQVGTMSLSGIQNPYNYDSLVTNNNHGSYRVDSNHGNQGTESNLDNHGYDIDHKEQIRLRENALQNGGPKFAFMNEGWTDGELPETMGRDSPAGSLTSLDSLDAVPSDKLMTEDMLCQTTPVTGIIVKDNRATKSAGRRRVTFSDSIEFDDGLTGQLVTAEKASCKQYVKLYNSRIAASNAYNASNGPRPTLPVSKGINNNSENEGVVGTQGNIPMKNNGSPCIVSLQSGSSASMIVPKSIYSQIPYSGNKTVATTGESTSSSSTQTDHPAQCVAQIDPGHLSEPSSHDQYGTSTHGTRETGLFDNEHQRNKEIENKEIKVLELKDSLDIMRDSLDFGEKQVTHQQEVCEIEKNLSTKEMKVKEEMSGRSGNEVREDSVIHEGTQDEIMHVDYYGNPTTIYRNPFGQRISTEEANRNYNTTTANVASGNSSTQLVLTNSEHMQGYSSGSSGQHDGGVSHGDYRGLDQHSIQENITNVKNKDSVPLSVDSKNGVKNSSYYRSWYPGSFFPSKSHEEREGDVDGDDKVFEEAKYTRRNNSVAYNLMDDQQSLKEPPDKRKIINEQRGMSQKTDSIGGYGKDSKKYTSHGQKIADREQNRIDETDMGSPVRNAPKFDYTKNNYTLKSPKELERSTYMHATGYPRNTPGTTPNEDSDTKIISDRSDTPVQNSSNVSGMTAKPPHPSTRHKGVVYSSPLHRKRAAAAVRHHSGKNSPRNSGKKTHRNVVRKKEDLPKRNAGNQKLNLSKTGQNNRRNEMPNSESEDDDEVIKSIKRDMERINMHCNASPAQEEHQKSIYNLRGHVDSPYGVKTLDEADVHTKSDFRTVYKKVHRPRVGSAKQRSQKMMPNKVPPSKIPLYVGPSGNGSSRASVVGGEDGSKMVDSSSQALVTPARWAEQGVSQWTDTNELRHPQTTNLKRSISLDKTPTDDEINILWDRVRNCLNHKETQSVGSDSCVNKIDVRRSKTQTAHFVPQGSQDATMLNPNSSQYRATSGIGTVGGLRRYGSHEVLRRYGSADNLGYRPQPLLQQRAQRTRQSGQGKPPIVPRQQMNFSPMASRQAPVVSLSTRAAPIPLTQTELRAVMKASQQTQEKLFRTHYEPTVEQQPRGYQTNMNTRKAPSALSLEEHRLLESLDRLNERLKVQEAITANMTHHRTGSANPSVQSRPASKQRASSSTYRYK